MAKTQRKDIDPDDYLETELGYDMPEQKAGMPKTKLDKDVVAQSKGKAADSCNPDDFMEAELGYEMDAGQEACE